MTQLLIKTIADFSTTLTSKTATGDTTATLTSGLDSDGVQLPTGVYGFTIDRNNTQKEHFTATLTVDALTDIKTVTRGTGVGIAGFIRTHRKGAEIVITDHVALKRMMNVLDGTTSFDSATPLGYDGAPTISTGNQFATKTYVDGVAIAGGADSSTSTKGIGRVSVAPVSATTPIFVGDNDPRVAPNNHETSTGSSNAYVVTLTNVPAALVKGQMYSFLSNFANTAAATVNINSLGVKTIKKQGGATDLASGDIASGMLVTVIYDGTNMIMVNPVANAPVTVSPSMVNFLCGETITVGTPVAASYYQSDNGVQFDTKVSTSGNVAPATPVSVTLPITIGANSNRAVVVFCVAYSLGGGPAPIPQFDGVAMTAANNNLADSYPSYGNGSFYVLNPGTGIKNVTWSLPAGSGSNMYYSIHAYSYYNVNTSAIDGNAYNTSGTSQSYTITNLGSVLVSAVVGASSTAGGNMLLNTASTAPGSFGCITAGDSGQIVPIQSNSVGAASGGSKILSISLRPVTAAAYGYVKKTSASSTTNTAQSNLYNSFIGFVYSLLGGGTAGDTASVQTDGVITGLSGLIPFATYYLSNTSGLLSTTAGTNSKKVGMAVSTTSLMIKHDN